MQPGYAYVLVSESPDVMWAEASSGNVPQAARPGAVGPITAMPQTLGEFLLTEHGLPRRRIMLVFVALIPERLFEPYVVPSEADRAVDQ